MEFDDPWDAPSPAWHRKVRRLLAALSLLVAISALVGLIGLIPVITFRPVTALAAPRQAADMPAVAAVAPPPYPGFRGLPAITEYTNRGAVNPSRACGQAAAATVLGYWYPSKISRDQPDDVRRLEQSYPYDVEWGFAGTSPARMNSMLAGSGLNVAWGSSEASLRAWVAAGYPVVVVLDTDPTWHQMGLHWTVVIAYDNDNVYLTNWPGHGTSWSAFRKSWTGTTLVSATGVSGRFLVASPHSVT